MFVIFLVYILQLQLTNNTDTSNFISIKYISRALNNSGGSPVDMDLDSPFSPGSGSDLSDLFEPPTATPPVGGARPSESHHWAKIIGEPGMGNYEWRKS